MVDEIRKFFGDCGLDFLDVARLKTNEAFARWREEIEAALSQVSDARPGAPGSEAPLNVVITPKLGTPAKWNHDPQWIYKKVGALRLELAKKFADKHGLFEQTGTRVGLPVLLGDGLSHVRVG